MNGIINAINSVMDLDEPPELLIYICGIGWHRLRRYKLEEDALIEMGQVGPRRVFKISSIEALEITRL